MPALVLFDGVCNLCNSSVQWIIRHDPQSEDGSYRFRFASLGSAQARKALAEAGLGRAADLGDSIEHTPLPDSMVLIEFDRTPPRASVRSDAVLRIAARLGPPWSLARAALVIPRPLRDVVYRWIARNRYRWFGRRDECMVPTPALRERFLDSDEPRARAAGAS